MTARAPDAEPEAHVEGEPEHDLPNLPLIAEEIEYRAGERAASVRAASGNQTSAQPGGAKPGGASPGEVKPTWRGWIHAGTFPVAIVLGVILIVLAQGVPAKLSSAVFVASSLLLFGTSALYHRINWSPKVKAIFKRIDHANIFVLIAGSYTPITVLALPSGKAAVLLWMIWTGAALGIGFRIFWIGAPRWLYVPLYVLLGWAAVLFIADFFRANWIMMTLIIVGGLLYTLGAVFYGLKRPNPFPGRFGFHEIFHSLTLLAFLCHWTGILLIAISPPALL